MSELLGQFTKFISPYFSELSLMLVATVLVVYGDVLNKQVKTLLSGFHFVLRTIGFVLLCAFGYGLITIKGGPFIQHVLAYTPWDYRGLVYLLAFVTIGVLAERRRYI